ncbi:MAG: nucleotidyl transferase AbiEii/AbiGii toxin family protein [Oscillospiraceae bacterium]|nr:nucleotidyl transferase AbiEii/AbiGii toxin family protein [Oscillospiraceae bacterium]
MNNIISQMLSQHRSETQSDKKNSIKEVVQEIILCGLSRAGFFQKAAFYGGTALRIFHGLDRFSEDLDFSLIAPDPSFRLDQYLSVLEKELGTYGFSFKAETKAKAKDSDVQSAFVKGNTREHILLCYADEALARSVAGTEQIKVKFEVDTTPPPYAGFERQFRLLPIPYEVNLYDMPSLFAGKLHAVICRAWKSRIKGRDLYDYVFYLAKGTPVNLKHLNARLVDSGFEGAREDMELFEIRQILDKRFESIDYAQAKADVLPFIRDPASLDMWSSEFFRAITKTLKDS